MLTEANIEPLQQAGEDSGLEIEVYPGVNSAPVRSNNMSAPFKAWPISAGPAWPYLVAVLSEQSAVSGAGRLRSLCG